MRQPTRAETTRSRADSRQNYHIPEVARHFFAQLLGHWENLIDHATAKRCLSRFGCLTLVLASMGCTTAPSGESQSRIRMQVPAGVAKLVVIGSAADSSAPILDEIGRQRRPVSVLIKPDSPSATTTWIDPAPLSQLSDAEGTALTTPTLPNTRRVVLLDSSPRTIPGLLELTDDPEQPALEVLAERALLDDLLIDRRIASALGADRLTFRAIEPRQRVDLGDRIGLTLLRIGSDVACQIEGPKRRILYAPRIQEPTAPGWEDALRGCELRLLDARLDPAAGARRGQSDPPAVPAVAHRIKGFVATGVRFLALDSKFGVAGNHFIDAFRARGYEIVFEGDEYWM